MGNKMITLTIDTTNIIENANQGVIALEPSVAKQYAGGLNLVLGCSNFAFAPTGSQVLSSSNR
jgi:hypothetical protein